MSNTMVDNKDREIEEKILEEMRQSISESVDATNLLYIIQAKTAYDNTGDDDVGNMRNVLTRDANVEMGSSLSGQSRRSGTTEMPNLNELMKKSSCDMYSKHSSENRSTTYHSHNITESTDNNKERTTSCSSKRGHNMCNNKESICNNKETMCNNTESMCNNKESMCNNTESMCNNSEAMCNNKEAMCNNNERTMSCSSTRGQRKLSPAGTGNIKRVSDIDDGDGSQTFVVNNDGKIKNKRLSIRRNALCDPLRLLIAQPVRERIERDIQRRKTSLARKFSQYVIVNLDLHKEEDLL